MEALGGCCSCSTWPKTWNESRSSPSSVLLERPLTSSTRFSMMSSPLDERRAMRGFFGFSAPHWKHLVRRAKLIDWQLSQIQSLYLLTSTAGQEGWRGWKGT